MSKRFALPLLLLPAVIALFAFIPAAQTAPSTRADLWVTNGPVYSTKLVGATLYVGGQFDHVGPATGAFAAFDAQAGAVEAGWPRVDGVVNAVAPDGAGGWYVGGRFSSIGGVAVNNLAHLRADKTLDEAWLPNPVGDAPDAGVSHIEAAGGLVYVCGKFNSVRGQARKGLAALDPTTGAATAWNPNPSGEVRRLKVEGSTLYLAGSFTAVGLTARGGAAAVGTDGQLLGWNPQVAGGAIGALAVSGGTIYLGGSFTSVGGQARSGLAAVDAAGAVTSWNPGPSYLPDPAQTAVHALAVDGTIVYAGGRFTSIGGQPRQHLAALDAETAEAAAWDPSPSAEGAVDGERVQVNALAAADGAVYVAGAFTHVGGAQRRRLAALDPATGAATAWRGNAGRRVNAVASAGGRVAAGGDFRSVGGVRRHNLAAFDLQTGRATDWNPDPDAQPNGSVKLLATNGDTIFAYGTFTRVGGAARARLAELNLTTGQATAWTPAFSSSTHAFGGEVADMLVTATTLYLAGDFTAYKGTTQYHHLAAASRASGALLDFRPEPNSSVGALAASGNTLYVGGSFWQIAGAARSRAAAFDMTTHALTDWKVGIGDYNYTHVGALAVSNGRVYLGGRLFDITDPALPGQPAVTHQRGYLAAVEQATGRVVASFDPAADNVVTEIEISNGVCYLAAINGDRRGMHWGSGPTTGSGWTDSTKDAFPDRLEIAFAGAKTITEVNVFGVQDNFSSPSEPTAAMTSASYALQDFDVEYWTGSAWALVPGGRITGNERVWAKLTFPALTTTKIRLTVKRALGSYSRVVEVEAY